MVEWYVWNTFDFDSQLDPAYASRQLGYSGGLFSSTDYNITVQPKMHFDAAILDGSDQANNPSSGQSVSTWGDRSGQATNYDASQSNAQYQPTFNVSGDDKYVSFDGSNDTLSLANSISRSSTQPWTIIQVGNASSSSSTYYPAPNVDNTYSSVQLGVYLGSTIYVRGQILASGVDYSALNMFTITRNSSNTVEAFRDGNSSEGTRASSDTFLFNNIGQSGSTKTAGNIYEAIFFDQLLSTTDLNTINSYLANKYSGLPSLATWT